MKPWNNLGIVLNRINFKDPPTYTESITEVKEYQHLALQALNCEYTIDNPFLKKIFKHSAV